MEVQEIHCHACNRTVRFELDLSLNGNHVLKCPQCGHEHCRVVKDGKITGDRWAQRNGPTLYITTAYITVSTAAYTDVFLRDSWLGTASGTTRTRYWTVNSS